MYVGELKNGIRNGLGTLTMSGRDGWTHVGGWKAGQKDGRGILYSFRGGRVEGEWKENKEWNAIEYDKTGNVTATYSEDVRKED